MAILKYDMPAGEQKPPFVFDGGYFTDTSVDPVTQIGIGLGGGTVLTHAELLTYVQGVHAKQPIMGGGDDGRSALTDSELETMVVNWYTDKAHTNPDGR